MDPVSVAVAIYALGAVVSAAFTAYAFRVLRASDEPEDAETLRPYNAVQQSSGLRDSGIAVFAGLIWPVHVPAFIASLVRARLGR